MSNFRKSSLSFRVAQATCSASALTGGLVGALALVALSSGVLLPAAARLPEAKQQTFKPKVDLSLESIKQATESYLPWFVARYYLAQPVIISKISDLEGSLPGEFICVSDLYLDRHTGVIVAYEAVESPSPKVSSYVKELVGGWKFIPEEVVESRYTKITVPVYFRRLGHGTYAVDVAI